MNEPLTKPPPLFKLVPSKYPLPPQAAPTRTLSANHIMASWQPAKPSNSPVFLRPATPVFLRFVGVYAVDASSLAFALLSCAVRKHVRRPNTRCFVLYRCLLTLRNSHSLPSHHDPSTSNLSSDAELVTSIRCISSLIPPSPPHSMSVPSSVSSPSSATRQPLSAPVPQPFHTEEDSSDVASGPRSLVEQAMARMSAAIRSKADWRTQRHDQHIVSGWIEEATSAEPLLRQAPAAVQYVLDELDYYDALLDAETGTEMSAVDGVWQSDSLLPSELIADIRQAVQQCWGGESTERRDWHPGSGGQVWDMVHPSLYCLVAGRTRVVAEDIGLERAIGMMCSGRLLGEREYGRLTKQQAASVRALCRRWHSFDRRWPRWDSDDEYTMQAEQLEQAELTEAEKAKAAWEVGKIALWVRHNDPKVRHNHRFVVYVRADARLADVKSEVAACVPENGSTWTLRRVAQLFKPEDETEPLYVLGVHSITVLQVEEHKPVVDRSTLVQAERDRRARQALQRIHIHVQTRQCVSISHHRLDQSATLQTLFQQLCDAAGEAKSDCYPSFARGLAPSEQRLCVERLDGDGDNYWKRMLQGKRLLPHHTFAPYGICNGNDVSLAWRRVTPAELAAEVNTIELRIQPLMSNNLRVLLLDVDLSTTVGRVRDRVVPLLPCHNVDYDDHPGRHYSNYRLYFPTTSDTSLDDEDTLLAVGIGKQAGEAQLGIRRVEEEEVESDFTAQPEEEEEDTKTGDGDTIMTEAAVTADIAVAEPRETESAEEKAQQIGQQLVNSAEMRKALPLGDTVNQQRDHEDESQEDGSDGCLVIHLAVPQRPRLVLLINPSMTVRELKQRIRDGQVQRSDAGAVESAAGVPIAEQQLIISTQQKVMNDARTLAFYGTTGGPPWLLWSRVDADTLQTNDTDVRCVGSKRLRLSHTDAPAARNDIDPCTIELSLQCLYGGTVFGDEHWRRAVDFPADLTIGELRQRVQVMFHTAADKVRLRREMRGTDLVDELSLSKAGLRDGDTLVVDIATVRVRVTLVLPSNTFSVFSLWADANTTVRELKERIVACADGYPVEWQWAELVTRTAPQVTQHGEPCAAASIEDELPLSQYGVKSVGQPREAVAHMLVCRRERPRPTQHNQEEGAEQPDQLLHLHVCSLISNDMYLVRVRSWQSLLAVKWQLTWKRAGEFDALRLSLCPPGTAPSAVLCRSAGSQLRPLTDEFASLQSLGVTDGRVLKLSRTEVMLFVYLPQGVEPHKRPLQGKTEAVCPMYAQLDDTVAHLKLKLSTLADLPIDHMLLRFHQLLPVDVDDSLTLRQLGFRARGSTDKFKEQQKMVAYVKEHELTVRLLPCPAAQPPSIEQQRANGLMQVGVRLLTYSARVYRTWVQSDDTMDDVRNHFFLMLKTTLTRVHPKRDWDRDSVTLTAGGRTADVHSAVSSILLGERQQLPVIDVIVLREWQPADVAGVMGADAHEEAMDEDEGREMTDEKEGKEVGQGDQHQPKVAGAEAELAEHYAPIDDPSMEDGPRFCLHPQHPLQLMRPYTTATSKETAWYCSVCSRDEDLTPDRTCWHCARCKYDVCQQCFNNANSTQPQWHEAVQAIADQQSWSDAADAQQQQQDGEDEDAMEAEEVGEQPYHTSAKYAWLPTDFHINDDDTARCLSYINNLHPVQHAAMYPLIEQVVGRFIPLFEHVLTSLRYDHPLKVPVGRWYDPAELERYWTDSAEPARLDGQLDDVKQQPIHQPDVPPFSPPTAPPSLVSLRGRRLQLIVRLADIVLTPEQPQYEGGCWRVDGMQNECIVATGVAYYDQCNISPSSLAFRGAVDDPQKDEFDANRGVEAVYGLRIHDALVQPLGAVDTCEGRCIAFPNIFQHRVEPFSLLDPTKPGHRSILALFLVDPAIPVTSTSRVPPQQREWIAGSEYASAVTDVLGGTRVLSELVDSYLSDWPMSRAEAEQHRAALMYERKCFVTEHSIKVFEREFGVWGR